MLDISDKSFLGSPQNPAVAVVVHPGTKGTKIQFMASSKKFKDEWFARNSLDDMG